MYNFANVELSEIILLRGELGRITFEDGSRVQEYMRTSPPPTPNTYEKLHYVDFSSGVVGIFLLWQR